MAIYLIIPLELRFAMVTSVEFDSGTVSMAHDWHELVIKPREDGRIREAFSAADAMIDDEIESMLRSVYNSHESQDLINHIHLMKGVFQLYGINLLRLLQQKISNNDTLSEDLVQRVRDFKKARDLVLHEVEGEYALVLLNPNLKYTNQKELDNLVKNEVSRLLGEGLRIFEDLIKVHGLIIDTGVKYFFSEEYYKQNPFSSKLKQMFPKNHK